jgi:hypothetical protein
MKSYFTLLLTCLLLCAPAVAQTPQKPIAKVTSKAAYTCPPTGNSTAMSFEVGSTSFTVRALIWGEGLSKLRRESKFLMERNGTAADRTFGFLELCESGKSCRPLSGRVELSSEGLLAGNPVTAKLIWFESKVNKEVALPVQAVIAPKEGPCS